MSTLNALGQPVGLPVSTPLPRPRPERITLEGQSCRLVPLQADHHAQALFEAFSLDQEGRNWTYLPYGPFVTVDDLHKWLSASEASADPLFFTILDQSGQAVGMASFLRIDPGAGVIEVGHIHMSPALQRRKASTEAMYLMMRYVFEDLGYRRYEWKCDALNAPSRAAAKRLGFQYEGTFRQATVYKGRNRDTAWFAIIDQDWPRLKAGFEVWLADSNFDAQGQQRAHLTFFAPD